MGRSLGHSMVVVPMAVAEWGKEGSMVTAMAMATAVPVRVVVAEDWPAGAAAVEAGLVVVREAVGTGQVKW